MRGIAKATAKGVYIRDEYFTVNSGFQSFLFNDFL